MDVADRILIVEDEESLADSIRYNLEREGFRARLAATGEDALNLILDRPPNLILLDLNLPHMSGFELCRRLRSEATTALVPILMHTARTEEADKVLGLNMGADDYITKPFSMRELVARVNAALRRAEGSEINRPVFDDGSLRIDPSTFTVSFRGDDVRMTRKEFALLSELARNQGHEIVPRRHVVKLVAREAQALDRVIQPVKRRRPARALVRGHRDAQPLIRPIVAQRQPVGEVGGRAGEPQRTRHDRRRDLFSCHRQMVIAVPGLF